jgi:fatty acid desaturase
MSETPRKPLFVDPEDPDRDVWIIHGKRYDLRPFLDRHPGGFGALEMARGRDCTELFESYHAMSDMPSRMLKQFEIKDAPVAPEPDFHEWDETPFYDTLKKRARAHFKARGGGMKAYKAPPIAIAQHGLWLVLSLVSFAAWATGHWWALATLPLFYWIGPSNLMHTGTHFALCTSPRWNRFWAYMGCAMMSPWMWERQHNIGHHLGTNLEGKDPDLNHFSQPYSPMPGFRTHTRTPWLRKYRFWPIAVALQATMTTMGPALINEPEYTIDGYMARAVPLLYPSKWRFIRHQLGRLILLAVCFVYPFFAFPLFKAAVFAFVPLAVHGLLYFAFSQVNHINSDCFVGEEIESGERRIEWAELQVRTCKDYAQHSRFWGIFSIGLNLQTVHHLFPQVDPWHYQDLSEIVAETCAEFDIPYLMNESWFDSFRELLAHIRKLNAPVPANLAHEAGNIVLPKGGHLRTTNLKGLADVDQAVAAPR